MKHGSLHYVSPPVKDRLLPDRYLGRQIGKYRVTRLLGGGAFAWVYEAVDRDLEIPVALKILRPEFAGQADSEARFRREAATAARLRHPNIVTVRDVGQIDGASFVAMDLLPLSLARRLELLSRLPEAEVVRIGLDVAAALSVAHAGGIVHRDIKPDNILIGANGEAVVADFGLARALSSGASISGGNQVTGTPHYFSPEQARGLELDGRSDLYSLGVTLFRAATGRLPFEGDDWYAVARQHIDDPAPSAQALIPELTDDFEQLLARLLRKDPAERFATAIQVADALAGLTTAPVTRTLPSLTRGASETITVPSSGASHEAVAAKRRRMGWIAGAAAVVAIVAATQFPALRGLLRADEVVAAQSDSTIGTPADTLPVKTDSAPPAMADTTTAKPVPVKPASDNARRQAAAAVRTRLTVTAPDSANIYIDDVMMGRGSVTIERPSAARIALRAVLAEAPVECATASRDSVVMLRVGEKSAVTLAVRTCLGVRFTVVPTDAQVRFVSVDGSAPVTVRADTARSVLLPEGRYEMRVTAGRCNEYRDSVIVRRGLPIDSLSRSVKLSCGG